MQLPEPATANDIAAIARERDEMEERMSQEWEQRFSFNFAAFENKKPPGEAAT